MKRMQVYKQAASSNMKITNINTNMIVTFTKATATTPTVSLLLNASRDIISASTTVHNTVSSNTISMHSFLHIFFLPKIINEFLQHITIALLAQVNIYYYSLM